VTTFKKLPENNNIQELIKSTFDVDLELAGNWGYTQESATSIKTLPENIPLTQLQHMITSMRAHLEMNITQAQENRYSGINTNEEARDREKIKEGTFDKVTYRITAMKENIYTAFIQEYKDGYGNEDFDLSKHFKRREDATLTREIIHYFDVSQLS
jgi:hypothetical protein